MAPERRETLSAGAGLAAEVALESGGQLGEAEVKARGYWEQVWRRFARDKIAIASGVFIILMLVAAFFGAPLAEKWLGHGPNDIFPSEGVDPTTLVPVGPLTTVHSFSRDEDIFFLLGASDTLGRDEFLLLLFVIALAATAGDRLSDITLGIFQPGVIMLILIGGIFGWFYPARIVRAQVLSLREKEFVEAARMV